MRCSKARELFFGNYDRLLNETQRIKLQTHLDRCPECASFVEEMEACLGVLRELPELTPSENFEWNLKRRILQEKSRLMRQPGVSYLLDIRWGMKFAASAAAVIAVALVGAWFLFSDHPATVNQTRLAERTVTARHQRDVSMPRFDRSDPTTADRPVAMRRVSDGESGAARQNDVFGPQAFQSAARSREDSLFRENEYLKQYIQRIEHENLILKQYLYRARARR